MWHKHSLNDVNSLNAQEELETAQILGIWSVPRGWEHGSLHNFSINRVKEICEELKYSNPLVDST